jgi:cell wall-associated NlpC family hydrolase
MTEADGRAAVLAEAQEWLLTPYHHQGRVKGANGGVDCAMLLAEVYERAGLIPHVSASHYPRDWHFHASQEGAQRFLSYILPHAVEIPGPPGPGDVVTYHIGKGFAHAGIVVEWPEIIHSDMECRRVIRADGTQGRFAVQGNGEMRPVKFFTLWADK